MNRTALIALVVLSALMVAPWAASADSVDFTVRDPQGNVVAASAVVKMFERPIGGSFTITDSTLVESKTFPSGSGQINARISRDFTGDDIVGFDDFFLLANAFGSKRGDVGPTGYVEAIDLVRNDKIDFNDFFKFVEGWEQTNKNTKWTLAVSSPDTTFASRDTSFVGAPPKTITLKVQVKNLRQELVAFVAGDTSRIFAGDTLTVRAVRKTFYGTREVQSDTLSNFEPGPRLVTTTSGILKINVHSGQLTTLLTVRVQPLRVVFFALLESGKNTMTLGDTAAVGGGIDIYRDTVQVAGRGINLDSLKIITPLKTVGRFVVGDKVGTFVVNVKYDTLTVSFPLTVNPPSDSTPPSIRLAVDVRNNRLTLAVTDSSGQVTVNATKDGGAVLSGTFAKLDTVLTIRLADFSTPLFHVDAADRYGNKASRDTSVNVPDRTVPYVRLSEAALKNDGTLHLRVRAYDHGGINNRGGNKPLTVTVRLADGSSKSQPFDLWDDSNDSLFVWTDIKGFQSNTAASDRKVTVIAAVTDRAGNVGQASVEVTQPGTPPPPPQETQPPPPSADTTPPSVSISSPAGNATVSGTITVSANASDDRGVSGVQFKLDGNNLGSEVTSGTYSVQLDTKTLSNGSHSVTAVARDAAGNSTTSVAASFTVSNVAPSFTTATASRSGQSFASGSPAFSVTVGQVISFALVAAGTPTPTVTLTVSVANSSFLPASNPFVPQPEHGGKVLRFIATAANGVGTNATATWTSTVQGGAP